MSGQPQRRSARTDQTRVKGRITRTRKAALAEQWTRGQKILGWFEERRQRSEDARDRSRKVAREQRQADRKRRGYHVDEPATSIEWLHEHLDRPMKPYRSPGDRDRSLNGKARIKARKAANKARKAVNRT